MPYTSKDFITDNRIINACLWALLAAAIALGFWTINGEAITKLFQ